MHVGSVMVFDAPTEGFDYESLVALISERIAHVPRYRQRIKTVPGGLANPVWVDDRTFDISYHVRRSALPRPGSDEQLEELVARIQPRALDRSRPLWEVYLVEGLAEDRFAIITKTHHSLVDGISAVDIGNVLVDGNPSGNDGIVTTWRARPEPSAVELVVGAVTDAVRTPSQVVDTVQNGVADVKKTLGKVASVAGDVLSTVARVSTRPAPTSPLNASIGRARRYVMVGTDLEDYRTVRARLGQGSFADEVSVNDVILATIAGAFRSWLLTRGESVYPGTSIRAMVPVSVHDGDDAPTGRPDDRVLRRPARGGARSRRCACTRSRSRCASRWRAAHAAPSPPTPSPGSAASRPRRCTPSAPASAGWSRAASTTSSSPTSPGRRRRCTPPAPGWSRPTRSRRWAATRRCRSGVTSYDGGVYYGLYADRDAMPDADVLGRGVVDALQELLDAPRVGAR